MSEANKILEVLAPLLDALFEGSITQQQQEELESLLLSSAEAQQTYVDFIALHSELKRIHVDSKPVLSSMLDNIEDEELSKQLALHEAHSSPQESMKPTLSEHESKQQDVSDSSFFGSVRLPVWNAHPARFVFVVTAIVLLFWVSGYFIIRGLNPWNHEVAVEQPTNEMIARISNANGVQWEDNSIAFEVHSSLYAGQQLKIKSGLLEVIFSNKVIVLLEGPCDFTISQIGAAELKLGKARAYVPKIAVGFTVTTPSAEIVDLGTHFGVEVSKNGTTEAKVMKGKVRVTAVSGGNRSEPIELTAGESVKVSSGSIEKTDFDKAPKFVDAIDSETGPGLGKMKAEWVLDSPGQAKIFASRWPVTLAMKVPPHHNSWDNERGLAPMVYQKERMPQSFSITTEIKYSGMPDAGIAGPMVYDAKAKHYAIQVGLEKSDNVSRVTLQSPGFTHGSVACDLSCVQLRLDYNEKVFTAYYRPDSRKPWKKIGSVHEQDLAGGEIGQGHIGMLTKSHGSTFTVVNYNSFAIKVSE